MSTVPAEQVGAARNVITSNTLDAGEGTPAGLSGVTGVFADIIAKAGEVGVGLLTFVETIIPPVPSEVLLPLAGFLAQQGALSLAWVFLASVLGSLVGAWTFYCIGAAVGLERAITVLARIPLLERDDLERATSWFHRHGRPSIFYGRFVPGVRSLISLPAGTDRMPLLTFTGLTAAGSAVWNALLIGAGYLLGTQWEQVGQIVGWISDTVLMALLLATVWLIARRLRARRRADSANGSSR